MKHLFLLMVAALLSASPALAHIQGNWIGQIHFTSSQGDDEMWDCTIGVIPSGKYLYVDDSDSCTYTPDYVTRFTVKEGQIFFEGKLYGTLDEHGIHLTLTGDDYEWHLKLNHREDGTLDVNETYAETGEEPYNDLTEGNLGPDVRFNLSAPTIKDRKAKRNRPTDSRR
jgi:hypothetical protein